MKLSFEQCTKLARVKKNELELGGRFDADLGDKGARGENQGEVKFWGQNRPLFYRLLHLTGAAQKSSEADLA